MANQGGTTNEVLAVQIDGLRREVADFKEATKGDVAEIKDSIRFISRALITGFLGLGFSVASGIVIFFLTKGHR